MLTDTLRTFVTARGKGSSQSLISKFNSMHITSLIQSIRKKEKCAPGWNDDSLFIDWKISEQAKRLSRFNGDIRCLSVPIQHYRDWMCRSGIMETAILAIQNAIDQSNEHVRGVYL